MGNVVFDDWLLVNDSVVVCNDDEVVETNVGSEVISSVLYDELLSDLPDVGDALIQRWVSKA